MIKTNIIALALASLMTLPAIADEASKPQAGDILQGINMFTPEDDAQSYKIKANETYGTQWYADVAYGYWHSHNTADGMHSNANLALIHAALNQRLIKDDINGGTWLRVEFSGSWGLDRDSAQTEYMLTDAFNSATYPHADIYGGHDAVIPELAIMHYMAGKKVCIIAGMVNMTNYFDAVSIANDSFSSFTNDGFINSSVLALPDANLGAVVQAEINNTSYAMLGFSREATGYGDNPFSTGDGSFLLVGEYGRLCADGNITLRFNPFYRHIDDLDGTGSDTFGLAASIEYTLNDAVTVYARSGFSVKQELGNAFDFSCGANFSLIPTREDDFLGIALGVFKGSAPTEQNREYVAEAIYSFQVNDYFKIVPHIQYIANPAYNPENSDAMLLGVQGVFSF